MTFHFFHCSLCSVFLDLQYFKEVQNVFKLPVFAHVKKLQTFCYTFFRLRKLGEGE